MRCPYLFYSNRFKALPFFCCYCNENYCYISAPVGNTTKSRFYMHSIFHDDFITSNVEKSTVCLIRKHSLGRKNFRCVCGVVVVVGCLRISGISREALVRHLSRPEGVCGCMILCGFYLPAFSAYLQIVDLVSPNSSNVFFDGFLVCTKYG